MNRLYEEEYQKYSFNMWCNGDIFAEYWRPFTYEEWIKNYPGQVLIIDGDTCKFGDNPEDFRMVTEEIDQRLYGLF